MMYSRKSRSSPTIEACRAPSTPSESPVRFARRRFGRYEVIDFVAVLLGYAISDERTLEAFYERLLPWASVFMALFGREQLPARSTLSRFLAALSGSRLSRPCARSCSRICWLVLWTRRSTWPGYGIGKEPAGSFSTWMARGRPLVNGRGLRARIDPRPSAGCVPCVPPFYTGRKRGEVVRTRTTVLHAHIQQWLASFGNPGNGQYREELRRAVAAIRSYVQAHGFPEEHAILRLDGQYGTGAVVSDLAGFSYVTRGKDYRLLDRAEVQARLHLPPDQQFSRPESERVFNS